MSSQSLLTSMPITRPCDRLSMLASFWCAVPKGRNQLFETMKRGGAGWLGSVVMPQGSDVAHHPATDPGRGRLRGQSSRTQIQKGQDLLIGLRPVSLRDSSSRTDGGGDE